MKLNVVIHQADEGGYWAEVPSIPGCATQGDSIEELLKNVHEAVEGCLSVSVPAQPALGHLAVVRRWRERTEIPRETPLPASVHRTTCRS